MQVCAHVCVWLNVVTACIAFPLQVPLAPKRWGVINNLLLCILVCIMIIKCLEIKCLAFQKVSSGQRTEILNSNLKFSQDIPLMIIYQQSTFYCKRMITSRRYNRNSYNYMNQLTLILMKAWTCTICRHVILMKTWTYTVIM